MKSRSFYFDLLKSGLKEKQTHMTSSANSLGKLRAPSFLSDFLFFRSWLNLWVQIQGVGEVGVKLTDSSRLETFNFPQNSGGGEEIREMSGGVQLKWILITLSFWCVLTEGRNQCQQVPDAGKYDTAADFRPQWKHYFHSVKLSNLICARWRSACTNEKHFLLQLILQTVA